MCRRLRDARKRAGLTQVEAAQALGQTQNFISKCETGERRIDPVELAEFMALYGTTFDDLVPSTGDVPARAAAGRKAARPKRVAEPRVKPRKEKPDGGRKRPGRRSP